MPKECVDKYPYTGEVWVGRNRNTEVVGYEQ